MPDRGQVVGFRERAQRAGQIETLPLAQTPVVAGYFYNCLTATATAQGATGVYPTAIGHPFPNDAGQGGQVRTPRRHR